MDFIRRMICIRRLSRYSYAISFVLFTLLSASLLAACGGRKGASTPIPYRPPTLEAAATPLGAPPPPRTFGEKPECNNGLFFIEDLTIPDGTQVAPGTMLDKRWRVQNTGTCNWDERYRLKEIAGPELGSVPEQRLYPARSGSEATIRIQFTAPEEAGTYRSAWQAYDPEDRPFGDPFFIEVVVLD
jgi:hypothetical protein